MRIPPYKKLTAGTIVAAIIGGLVMLAVVSLGWGWLFMVIAGACGWHIPLVPVCWAIGVGIAVLIEAVKS